jgi:solute carrier family 25 (mitochondrial phosphate transporter), member 23/24/25/41
MVGTKGYPTYTGFFDCITKIVKEEGPKGLYKGLWPCYLKVAPSMAILFWCNERLKVLIG